MFANYNWKRRKCESTPFESCYITSSEVDSATNYGIVTE